MSQEDQRNNNSRDTRKEAIDRWLDRVVRQCEIEDQKELAERRERNAEWQEKLNALHAAQACRKEQFSSPES